MGPRAMPTQVPIIPDASLEAQARALEFYAKFEKPFLSVFAGNDPVTNPIKDPKDNQTRLTITAPAI